MINSINRVGISLLLITTTLFSDISGTGFGNSLKEAKTEALSDLSQVIKSEVRTIYKQHSTDKFSKSDFKSQVTSNLPILGVQFHELPSKSLKEVKATLYSKKVALLYERKLNSLNKEMSTAIKELQLSKSKSFQLEQYQILFALTQEFNRYNSVARLIEPKKEYQALITHTKVESEILKLTSNIDSLEMASSIIASSLKQSDIYLYPPHIVNNTIISEFGSTMKNLLKGKVSTASSLYNAKYILVGEYTLAKESMILNMQLLDIKTKDVVNSKTIVINKKAYRDVIVKPKGVDFNTLLTQGVALSSSLKVTLNSNRGSESLLFTEGDEIELFVKLNKMGYLYIVGYTQTSDTKLSYLLELSEGEGDSKFVKFINADDASRWISLGAFNIEPPFGIESLQVIASNKRISHLPEVQYDENSGYYIISKELKKALQHTRGLRPKRSAKVESSEDVMSFTTMKK